MGTLSSELAAHAERLTPRPRVYADANVPAGLVAHMRRRLGWDVLFVLEEEGLRRAPDVTHYRLAHQLRRTLVTLDRDYLDDRRFPPEEGCGILVIHGPDERELACLLDRVHHTLFGGEGARGQGESPIVAIGLPLEGRKLHAHTDWGRRSEGEEGHGGTRHSGHGRRRHRRR
jgi:hypothetical protein